MLIQIALLAQNASDVVDISEVKAFAFGDTQDFFPFSIA